MVSVAAPRLRNLHLEIKFPKEDELQFMQLHSTTAVITLKSKIFRKPGSYLEGEKPENYVLALKGQDSKVEVLAEDKLIGSHPWIEAETKSNFFTIHVMPKDGERLDTLKRKNSFTRLSMHDDTSRFLLPLPSVNIQLPAKQLPTNTSVGKSSEGIEGDSKEETPKLPRSKSEPILRPTRSMGSMSEITDFDLLSSYSSDVESLDGEEDTDSTSSHSNTAHDDAAQLSPKLKSRERSATGDKGVPHKKIVLSGSFIGKEASLNSVDKSKNKKSLWSLFPKREEERDGKNKPRKRASMIITRTDSGTFQAGTGNFTPVVNKHRSASFEAEAVPVLPKALSTVAHPVPADYSLKRTNSMLIVEDDGGKIVLTAGTVEQLICCLADRDIPDAAYLDEFFYSMSYFTNGCGLMSHLRKRYEYPAPEDATHEVIADYDKWRPVIQQRVLNVMRYVIENHWYHIERDDSFLPAMKEFVESSSVKQNTRAKSLRDLIMSRIEAGKDTLKRIVRSTSVPTPQSPSTPPPSHTPPAEKGNDGNAGSTDLAVHGRSSSSPIIVWRARRDTLQEHSSNTSPHTPPHSTSPCLEDPSPSTPTSLTTVTSTINFPPPKPLGKRFKDHRKVSFTRVHPLEMARQLTLIEKELFRAIRPPELVGAAFKKKNKSEISPNVVQMIEWFNHVTAWVQKELVLTPNLKERTSVLGLFIQVAAHLREIGNLSGAMQIVCALDASSVKRLHKTWKGLPRKDVLTFSSLEEAFTSKSNFANYRRLSHDKNENSTGAVLPYIGVVLQDLLMIEELPTSLANGMINFRKMRRFASLLRSEILERQSALPRFNFEPVHAIQEYLARRTPLNEQDLYRYSRLSEPSKMVP